MIQQNGDNQEKRRRRVGCLAGQWTVETSSMMGFPEWSLRAPRKQGQSRPLLSRHTAFEKRREWTIASELAMHDRKTSRGS